MKNAELEIQNIQMEKEETQKNNVFLNAMFSFIFIKIFFIVVDKYYVHK